MRKRNITAATLVIAALAVGSASASVISVNFVENASNQIFAGGENIGPLATDSSNWNSNETPDTGNFAAGTMGSLIDDTGANTGADIAWTTGGTYWQGDGTGDDQHKLSVGYLDDTATTGGYGVRITVANVPYAEYRVYGLVASDQATLGVQNANVNGTWVYGDGSTTIGMGYGRIDDNNTANGSFWTQIVSGSVTGNYWTIETSGSTLTLDVLARNGGDRGAITGVIIEQIPEPATLGMVALFGGGLLFIRRKLSM